MNRILLIFSLIAMAVLPAGAGCPAPDSSAAGPFRRVENRAFGQGESLEFEVAYGMVKAGTASMSIPDTAWIGGRPCLHIVTTAESSPFFSSFFTVRDRVESWTDAEGLFSWRFEKHLREGKYRSNRVERYDPARRLVFTRRDTVRTPPFVQDILSAFYYTRTQLLHPGQAFDIDCFGGKRVYPLRVLIHRREKTTVPAGTFRCVVVEPVLRDEGLFNQKGKLTIWMTDDERRIPVLMKSKVLIGSIDVRLTKIDRR
jgi:hypothetical protein